MGHEFGGPLPSGGRSRLNREPADKPRSFPYFDINFSRTSEARPLQHGIRIVCTINLRYAQNLAVWRAEQIDLVQGHARRYPRQAPKSHGRLVAHT